VATGTPVEAIWQFRNPCRVPARIDLGSADFWLGASVAEPGDVVYIPVRCGVGEVLCYTSTAGPGDCGSCAPGIMPVRRLSCR
jgi:hypothetical protein